MIATKTRKASSTAFAQDVVKGLTAPTKYISSKYFYDEIGDGIFQEIMAMEEYYLPECEMDIFKRQSKELALLMPSVEFDIVELETGDGSKTSILLSNLVEAGKSFRYLPLDISPDVLETNATNVQRALPMLDINPIPGDYFDTLKYLNTSRTKVILFMGSNIGNYQDDDAVDFLKLVRQYMNEGDVLLVGVDLKKNPATILKAYDDEAGITRRFNLNLLHRMNRELEANIDVNAFAHYPLYEPVSGIAYSYLVSLKEQVIDIDGTAIKLGANELIHTEVSQKYSLPEVDQLSEVAGFSAVQHFTDSKSYFSVSAFQR